MFKYLLNILQLLLNPENGWEDVAKENADPDRLKHRGLLPVIALSALTEFVVLFYVSGASLLTTVERAILDFGCYYVAAQAARLLMEMYAPRLVSDNSDPELTSRRIYTVATYGTGLMAVAQIIVNCFPPGLNILKFIPLYILLVVYESGKYLGIRQQADMYYAALVAAVVVSAPLILYTLLMVLL